MKKRKLIFGIALIIIYFGFLLISMRLNFYAGIKIGENSLNFFKGIIPLFPGVFILIGLFEVWVKRETVEKHFGKNSGFRGYFWGIILASTTVGGIFIAFPIAYSLHNKGAKLSVIFTYIGASATCRIPMTMFEASFLGIKFTLIRLCVSLPLIIITSIFLGNYLEKNKFQIQKGA
ncbi:MAG: permease [Candidatus Cloacimonadota bacterium]|nr:permease [Candidatus Cloacimonadota bacterium]